MFSNPREANTINYQFLSVAAHYFYTTDNWQIDIRHLLTKLSSSSGTDRVSILECKCDSQAESSQVEIINSWSNIQEVLTEQHFFSSGFEESGRWWSILVNGQPFYWASTGTDSLWPDEREKKGLSSIVAFPVFVGNVFWGLISMENFRTPKVWNQLEIKVLEGFAGLLGRSIEKEQQDLALRLDKTYYEELFHSSPAAIVILDQKGVVERINREFTKLFQYQLDEIIGKKIDDILPSLSDKNTAIELTGRILVGERVAHEGIRYRKDGSPVHVSIVGVQSIPQAEEPAVYSIYHDITERVIAQENLKESQARFRLLFESANDAIFLLKDGFVIECNARTLDVFRCKREDILGKSAIDLSPVRQPSGILSLNLAVKYNRAAQEKEQQSFEWMHKRPDGSLFIAEVSISVFDWKGESFAQAIVRDISNRKHTEELLKQRYDFIAFLSRVSADLINLDISCIDNSIHEVLDFTGAYAGCSRSVIYLIDQEDKNFLLSYIWNKSENEGNLMEKIPLNDLPGIYGTIANGEIIVRDIPQEAKNAEDALIHEILDIANPFHSFVLIPLLVRGKFVGFSGYFTENTIDSWTEDLKIPLTLTNQMMANAIERKNVEQELKNAKEKAVESDKLKTAFLSSMSHEIRTPMNHILGFIELLKDPGLMEQEKMEFMAIVKSSGNLLLRLIDDIIDIAKIESGQLVINQVELQLDKFVDDIYLAFSEQIKNSGKGKLELVVVKPRHPVTAIITDPIRLQQVVSNLLSNAIKFTPDGRITLGYSIKPDHKIHFFVEDTGIGIPEEKHEHVFERFMQLDGSYAREYSGTGLGLAISKGLVELMEGEIGLISEPGKGSKFFFTIPYHPIHPSKTNDSPVPAHSKEHNFTGNVVMVVEDDEINYRFLEIVIHRTKAKVLRASTGQEAIDIATNHDLDLVLMDIQIPVLDGYQATREIKKIRPNLPIIAQTAHALAEEKARCLESGADDYLSKPISRKDLLAKMAQFLSNR
ncbi:MAG: PAS domain S-box protein [Bacteroidales bacterium]|nr:PAS domain S-box protein [Bacteroidales bacterium]